MNYTFLLFLVVLGALVALSSARPIVFVVDQVNTTTKYSGVGMAWGTHVQGKNDYRLRVFGLHNISGDTVTGAFLVTFTQVIQPLKISPANGGYYVADIRFNSTVWNWLLQEQVGITVTTQKFPVIAITGALVCRVNLALTILNGAGVVPSSSVQAVGIGLSYIGNSFVLNPTASELITVDTGFLVAYNYYAHIVYTPIANVTGASYNGPSNVTSTGPVIAPLQANSTYAFSSNPAVQISFFAQNTVKGSYLQVSSSAAPNGAIRGNLVPLVTQGRRHVPFSVTQVYGNTQAPNGYATLQRASQVGHNNHPAAYIALQATQAVAGTGNFTYQGVFNFMSSTRKQNVGSIRALIIELNIRISGGGNSVWIFEWFNFVQSSWVLGAQFSVNSGIWTAGFIPYTNATTAYQLASSRAITQVRITCNNGTPTKLLVDLFGIRGAYINSGTNGVVKKVIKLLPQLATQ